MTFVSEARKLANYISGLEGNFQLIQPQSNVCAHIGALYSDIILQAGLNYNSVVKPRVNWILKNYPEHNTVQLFVALIQEKSLEKIINWRHPVKLKRIDKLLNFSLDKGINTTNDLSSFMSNSNGRNELLKLNGIGPKTIDYALRLLNHDTVAVDRHIYHFLENAGIINSNYYEVKKIVEYAADFLSIPRGTIDYSIWKHMSVKAKEKSCQLFLQV